ncbi:hypothetical protein DFH27DRAFT_329676 [Peziza echinospora]|nr:hypothetical protein DFH27DRAFT_329676 [Peziza echinospora]
MTCTGGPLSSSLASSSSPDPTAAEADRSSTCAFVITALFAGAGVSVDVVVVSVVVPVVVAGVVVVVGVSGRDDDDVVCPSCCCCPSAPPATDRFVRIPRCCCCCWCWCWWSSPFVVAAAAARTGFTAAESSDILLDVPGMRMRGYVMSGCTIVLVLVLCCVAGRKYPP